MYYGKRQKATHLPSLLMRVLTLSKKHSFSRVLASRISTSKKRTAFLDFFVVLVEILGPTPLTFLCGECPPSLDTKLPSMPLHTGANPPGVRLGSRAQFCPLYLSTAHGLLLISKGRLLLRKSYLSCNLKNNVKAEVRSSAYQAGSSAAQRRGSLLDSSAGCVPRRKLIVQRAEPQPFPAKYKTGPSGGCLASSLQDSQSHTRNF